MSYYLINRMIFVGSIYFLIYATFSGNQYWMASASLIMGCSAGYGWHK